MQGNRGGRDPFFGFGDPFAGFGGFGGFAGQRSLMSSFFGGRDPFDDPFFTRPFGGMFESSIFGPAGNPFVGVIGANASGILEHQAPLTNRSRGPIIEELSSDDEKEHEDKEDKSDNPRKHGRSSKEPYVEDPDDEAEGKRSKLMPCTNDFSRMSNTQSQPQSFTFQSSCFTYGGTDGAYYTSSRTRRTGSDGLTFEESKEADTASGRAAHQISRGIHDKGHTVVRKLNSDGRVNTMQTLHNLNEGELSGFEEAWKGNVRRHLPVWSEASNIPDGAGTSWQNGLGSRVGWALPSTEHPQHSGSMRPDVVQRADPAPSHRSGRIRSDVADRRGSSRGRPSSATSVNMDHVGWH